MAKTKKKRDPNLVWRSNVKSLFEEIMGNGKDGVALSAPLNITYSILQEVAKRCNELQDPELNSLMARLALYAECDPYSSDFKGFEFVERVIGQDPSLYQKQTS